jgi:hypothetical protein
LTQAEAALGELAESSYKDVVRRGIRNVARRLEHADKRRDEQASS